MWNLLNVDDDLLKHMLWFVQITGLDLLKRMTLAMQPDPSTCRSDASSNGMKPRARAQVGSVMIRPPKFSIAPVKLGKACLPTTIFQGKLLNLGGCKGTRQWVNSTLVSSDFAQMFSVENSCWAQLYYVLFPPTLRRSVCVCFFRDWYSHTMHVRYIYPQLPYLYGKFR